MMVCSKEEQKEEQREEQKEVARLSASEQKQIENRSRDSFKGL